ncbi:FUSC family protein [Salinisphaera sp. SPP-AMP-43]|uniref:FUSC family protein n=1 Tax=Salinisphaera sp. SPP-AMP-43 TaxID=3121288 RepID=UPI003C6DF055
MSRLAWLFAPSGENISFAIRCCVSVALSLWLAFWLQLDNAYWAFINVAILIQPLPGFLVVRGFARLAGTFVAGCVSVLLIALFAQSYTMFSVAMIAWVAAMVFCASLFRNNMSYGFVLAGYVTVIIGVRSMDDPSTVFSVAVARSAETALAAVVAAFVSVLLAPSVTAKKYFLARIDALKSIGRQFRVLDRAPDEHEGDDNPDTPHPQLHALVEKTLTLEQTRQYARFDAPGFSEYNRLARRLDYELLSIVSAMASLQVYLGKLGDRVNRAPLKALDRAAELLERDPSNTGEITKAFGEAYDDVLAEARRGDEQTRRQRSVVDWVVISRALDLANRMRAAVIKHSMLLAERGTGRRRTSSGNEFSFAVPVAESVKITIRAAAAMGSGAAIWATHDDPALAGTMVLLSVLTTLFALTDNPSKGARGFGIGGLCAGAAAFVVNFGILPHANSFAMLMLGILPFVFVAGLAMATPSMALIGRVGLVIFALLVHPDNDSRQTLTSFLETFLGAELAVGLALVAFAIVLPVDPRKVLRDRLAGIFGELSRGFAEPREHFETRIYDRLIKLPVAADQGEFHVSARQAAFAAVNMGLEARSLRVLADRAGFDGATRTEIHDLLVRLESLFKRGYPSIEQVLETQVEANRLGRKLLEQALGFEPQQRMRYGVRAAVAAELLAAALVDYGQAREHTDPHQMQLGEANHVT